MGKIENYTRPIFIMLINFDRILIVPVVIKNKNIKGQSLYNKNHKHTSITGQS